MTVGNVLVDRRYTAQTDEIDCYSRYLKNVPNIGFRRSRAWQGPNSPTVKRPREHKTFTYSVFSQKRGRWEEKSFRYRVFPKRERIYTENPYVVDGFKSESTLCESRSKDVCESGPNKGSTTYTHVSSDDFLGVAPHHQWDSNDELVLLGKLRERIQGEDFNLAIFLGEGRESLKTITDAANRIYRAGKELRKGRFSSAARTLATGRTLKQGSRHMEKIILNGANIPSSKVTAEWFASHWLQLQYGWIPLIKDCFAASAHLAYLQSRPAILTYRARRMLKGLPAPSASFIASMSGESRVFGGLKARLTHINEVSLTGVDDPASLVWEKLPYSFVADWFAPIGQYLSARALSRSLTGSYVKTTGMKVFSTSCTFKDDYPRTVYIPGGSRMEAYNVRRDVFSFLPVPPPRVRGLDKVASWSHCISAVSLLIQAFPRFGNR